MTKAKSSDKAASASVSSNKPLHQPFSEIAAEQAAPLLGIEYPLNLIFAEVGDEDFVPFVKRGGGRTFLLGDVLTEAAKRSGLPPPEFPEQLTTTLEAARAVLKKRVGPTPPAWHDEGRHRSNKDVPSVTAKRKPTLPPAPKVAKSSSMTGMLVGNLLESKKPKPKKDAHRPLEMASGVYRVKGATVTLNINKFSSLGDFLQNALLEDEWLFAVPPRGKGRPYDFLESLLAGDTDVPWKVMTYREYLKAMLDAAVEDEAIFVAEAEASVLAEESSPKEG